MKRLICALSLVVGCEAPPARSPEPVDVPRGDVAPPAATSNEAPDDKSSPLFGAFHEKGGGPDALNLVIDADGTWRWSINGCDFRGNACGTWTRRGDMLELSAAPGEKGRWMDEVGMVDILDVLQVEPSGSDLLLTGRVDAGEIRHMSQTWERGSVCAQCGGESLGPTSLRACDDAPPKSICRE